MEDFSSRVRCKKVVSIPNLRYARYRKFFRRRQKGAAAMKIWKKIRYPLLILLLLAWIRCLTLTMADGSVYSITDLCKKDNLFLDIQNGIFQKIDGFPDDHSPRMRHLGKGSFFIPHLIVHPFNQLKTAAPNRCCRIRMISIVAS